MTGALSAAILCGMFLVAVIDTSAGVVLSGAVTAAPALDGARL